MPDAKSSTVVVQRGVYTVARKTVDTEGNTIRETPPQWREDITGGSVIVCPINSETDEPLVTVNEKLETAKDAAHKLGVNPGIDPFMTLSFMALPVIPSLRITTRGVFDVTTQSYV